MKHRGSDDLWRRILAGTIAFGLVIAGFALGAYVGLATAESLVTGNNGFLLVLNSDWRGENNWIYSGSLIAGLALGGPLAYWLVFLPLMRVTGFVSERWVYQFWEGHRSRRSRR